jgi:hypothetical protein
MYSHRIKVEPREGYWIKLCDIARREGWKVFSGDDFWYLYYIHKHKAIAEIARNDMLYRLGRNGFIAVSYIAKDNQLSLL